MASRRTILSTVGLTLSASLSGCLGTLPALGSPRVTHPNETEVEIPFTGSVDRLLGTEFGNISSLDAAEVTVIGRGAGSNWVALLSESEDVVEATIAIRKEERDPFYETTVELSAEAYAAFNFLKKADYHIDVTWNDQTESIAIDPGQIDCNDSLVAALLTPNDGVETNGMSTTMGCGL